MERKKQEPTEAENERRDKRATNSEHVGSHPGSLLKERAISCLDINRGPIAACEQVRHVEALPCKGRNEVAEVICSKSWVEQGALPCMCCIICLSWQPLTCRKTCRRLP